MRIIKTITELQRQIDEWKREGQSIGLVPTMGYLHEGHASLMKAGRKENDKLVVSIFVNPTQFGPIEDLSSYPRDLERDSKLCEIMGVDVIFHPSPEEMYIHPKAYVNIDTLGDTLCGVTRPIHFKGVCTVVTKLFNIVRPTRAYFGEKDAQQLAIIRKMVTDLNVPVQIVGVPIVRESDGLAKSSRNTYLNTEEREAATVLYRAIQKGKEYVSRAHKEQKKLGVHTQEYTPKGLIETMKEVIALEPLAKIDYVSVVDAQDLQLSDSLDKPVLVAMAVYIGQTRLIDNFSYDPSTWID